MCKVCDLFVNIRLNINKLIINVQMRGCVPYIRDAYLPVENKEILQVKDLRSLTRDYRFLKASLRASSF